MRFAKWVFTAAGVYGLLVITPMLLLESQVARTYGPLTQPVWYYGFASTALAFQFVYLQIGRDPARFRPIMPMVIFAKLIFGLSTLALFMTGRAPGQVMAIVTPDLAWAVLFMVAFARARGGG